MAGSDPGDRRVPPGKRARPRAPHARAVDVVPTLERFWGTARFYGSSRIKSLSGRCGLRVGFALGDLNLRVDGLDPFIYAAIVAFGVGSTRAQPVQFFACYR